MMKKFLCIVLALSMVMCLAPNVFAEDVIAEGKCGDSVTWKIVGNTLTFSGSGAIGIEALSRGAARAVFVEKNPKACTCIRENLTFTKLADSGTLLNMDVMQALRSLEGKGVFDCIFMDPPYNHELERQVLEYLQDSSILDENTLIIVEADLTTDFGYVEDLGYRQLRSKEYKTNKHIFLCRGK